jgi:hypothetical protein
VLFHFDFLPKIQIAIGINECKSFKTFISKHFMSFMAIGLKGCISNPIAIGFRVAALKVGGGDTAHGSLPGLVSPPTRDILKYTRLEYTQKKKRKFYYF